MTPEYASPEQVRCGSITTATDVYSPRIFLYELLTGHRTYRIKTLSPGEMERVICVDEPKRPSTVVRSVGEPSRVPSASRAIDPAEVGRARGTSVEKLARRLAGDLDTIVMKALRMATKASARRRPPPEWVSCIAPVVTGKSSDISEPTTKRLPSLPRARAVMDSSPVPST